MGDLANGNIIIIIMAHINYGCISSTGNQQQELCIKNCRGKPTSELDCIPLLVSGPPPPILIA